MIAFTCLRENTTVVSSSLWGIPAVHVPATSLMFQAIVLAKGTSCLFVAPKSFPRRSSIVQSYSCFSLLMWSTPYHQQLFFRLLDTRSEKQALLSVPRIDYSQVHQLLTYIDLIRGIFHCRPDRLRTRCISVKSHVSRRETLQRKHR